MMQQPRVGQNLLMIEAARSHSATPQYYDSCGWVIRPKQKLLPTNAQLSQEEDFLALHGLETAIRKKQAASEQHLRPRGN
jgi:hypothetical protein